MEILVGNTCRGGPCEQQHGAVRAPFQLLQAGGERCSRGRAEAVAAGGGEGGRCGPRLELQPLESLEILSLTKTCLEPEKGSKAPVAFPFKKTF